MSVTALTPVGDSRSEEAPTIASGAGSQSRSGSIPADASRDRTRDETFGGPEPTVASRPGAKGSADES